MYKCLLLKFTQEPYLTKLLETGTKYIQEGNNWGDEYWGVNLTTGIGLNKLGHYIMEIRSLINSAPRLKK